LGGTGGFHKKEAGKGERKRKTGEGGACNQKLLQKEGFQSELHLAYKLRWKKKGKKQLSSDRSSQSGKKIERPKTALRKKDDGPVDHTQTKAPKRPPFRKKTYGRTVRANRREKAKKRLNQRFPKKGWDNWKTGKN